MFFSEKNLFIKHLTNRIIRSYLIDNEGLWLQFDNDASFVIDNNYIILNSKESEHKDLIWSKVVKIEQTKELFRLNLNNDIIIEVWLKDEDYNWPEALRLYLPNWQTIIE